VGIQHLLSKPEKHYLLERILTVIVGVILCLTVTACGISPRVMAQDRMFLPLSVQFLGEYQLPKTDYKDTPVGGLSAITYDRTINRYYVLSDDRSQKAPARFYTMNINIYGDNPQINSIAIEDVTFLTGADGNQYKAGSIDPEGIALSPRNTLYISSEGATIEKIPPFVAEFQKTGKLISPVELPSRYIPDKDKEKPGRGVQDNRGFEPLTLGITSTLKDDPFRLFTATENALIQDNPRKNPDTDRRVRMLHYVISPIGQPVLVSENLYLIDESPSSQYNGLVELLALEREGYFLSLERTFGLSGFGVKLFQVVNASSTDTSKIETLPADLASLQVRSLEKRLLLDLEDLGIDLDNLEGMTLGPRFPDGSRSLILVSDDNFQKNQINQFLLFRLKNL
jgi:hypothetical protein